MGMYFSISSDGKLVISSGTLSPARLTSNMNKSIREMKPYIKAFRYFISAFAETECRNNIDCGMRIEVAIVCIIPPISITKLKR